MHEGLTVYTRIIRVIKSYFSAFYRLLIQIYLHAWVKFSSSIFFFSVIMTSGSARVTVRLFNLKEPKLLGWHFVGVWWTTRDLERSGRGRRREMSNIYLRIMRKSTETFIMVVCTTASIRTGRLWNSNPELHNCIISLGYYALCTRVSLTYLYSRKHVTIYVDVRRKGNSVILSEAIAVTGGITFYLRSPCCPDVVSKPV